MKIIFQDQDIIVVDKPAGLKVYSQGEETSLMEKLIELHPELKQVGSPKRYGLVHRLDKETSGLVIIAKNEKALLFIQKQFKNREVDKTYLGLIYKQIKPSQGEIISNLIRSPQNFKKQKVVAPAPSAKGRLAILNYRTIKSWEKYSLLEIKPKTGRMHQIRVQLAWKQNPIVGDPLYHFKGQTNPEKLERMFLHSQSISIMMLDQTTKTFQSDLPEELKQVINHLDKK
jgi:23S rRNA pseudouridine1911/1915/1917 synthase